MALNVGTLVADLVLNRKDFDRGITESEGRFSKLAGALGTAAVRVGAAAGGIIVASGAVGLRTAASMEQAEIGFTTMLGSGAKAKSFLADLSAFAAKTPFAFPELQTAAASLVSAGVEANKVIPIMSSLGNATSGMGTGSEGVKRATIALQQMNAAGKITGEDLNQLRDAGIPVYDLLAAATGKSKEAVAELAAKGKLGRVELQQLMSALESGKGLERFTGLMEKQSTSLTGLWSTLKDTFSVGMATAIQPLIPLIKDGLGGAITGVAGFMPKLSAGLATTVAGLSEFIAGVTMSKGETAAYGAALDGAASVGNRVGVVIRTVAGAVREFAAGALMSRNETASYGAALDGAAAVGNRFGGAIRWVVEAVKELMAGLRTSKGEADAYGGALDGMALVGLRVREAIDAVFVAIGSGDVGKLKDGFAGAGEKASGLTGGLQSLKDMLPSLGTLIGAAADVVKFLADNSGLLVDALPFLIAGFVLYKASQVAANVAALASLPILVAQVVQGFALAASNNALAAALGYQRVSVLSSTLAWIGNTASAVANGVAQLALKAGIILTQGAIVGITVVQWLWNAAMAAMSATPLGLIVLGVAAVAGGLIYAYKHSETFRNIVQGAFDAVGAAVRWVVEKVADLFGWLSQAPGMGWAKDAADKMTGLDNATSGAGDSVDDLAKSEDAAKTATDNLNSATQTTLDKFTLLNVGALSAARADDAWKASLDAITESVKQNGGSLDNNTAAGRANRSAIEGAAGALNEKVKSDVEAMIKAGDLTGATRVATEQFEANRRKLMDVAVQSGLSREAAERYAGQLLATPDQIATAIQTPGLEAARREVQGLGGDVGGLRDKTVLLDVKANGSWTMSAARVANEHQGLRRATGGAIFGPGTSTSDSIPALLSNDEHVWTAEEVRQAGGHSRMYALRAAVRSGALGAYATGGAVGVRAAANIGRIVSEQYDPTERALLSGIAGATATGIAAAQAAAASLSSSAPGGVAGRGNVDAELLRRFDAWNASMGGVLRIVSGYRSSAKQAQLYASYLAGTGNLAARPGSSNHEKSPARAIDYGPASWSRTPGAYAYGLKAPVRSEPWHLERAFDEGGVARGSGMMPKYNPRPERVLSPSQTEAFERLVQVLDRQGVGAGVSVSVSADAGLAQQYAEQVAERTVVKWRDALAVSGLTSIL